MLNVHLLDVFNDAALTGLKAQLDRRVRLTAGLAISPETHILIGGRPTREQLAACPDLRAVIVPEYVRELEVKDGDRVLEVSIGTGANLHYLPVKAAYYGLDLSWGMLKRCHEESKTVAARSRVDSEQC